MKKFFLATLLVVMMITSTALAADWEQIYTDEYENKIFFDTSSVKTAVNDGINATFSATFRIEYSAQGREALIDWYRYNSIVPRDIETVSYQFETINFRKSGDMRNYYMITSTAYRADGSVIEDMQFTNPNPTWQDVPLNSLLEVEYYNALLIADGKQFEEN